MASCNECICSEVCYYKSFNDVRALKKRRNDVEKICKSFINRDAVEVVRCKDCKYYEHPEYYGGGTKDVCRTFKRQMKEDDFCSYGERKDND